MLGRIGRFSRSFSNAAVPPGKVRVTVNGKTVEAPEGATIMQACSLASIDIPRFCYHERLAIAGNCRMCLVQVNEGPKLVASCAAPIMPDMRIATESVAVKKAREGVMEFLLANHPLDCPICDQGGECDLQDQAMSFGSDRSRFQINKQYKRAVEDKDLGPLVKTSMNRCIHCTRCVRFANEIAGMPELGTTGRGNDMQIGTYIENVILESPLSGNLVDLCPVGALTSKPYAFTARPWELRHTDSIDMMDAMGSNIKIDSRGMEVMRILPRLNEEINEEWLADKSRFSYDGLRLQRLVQPLLNERNNETYIPLRWEEALGYISDKIKTATGVKGVVGRFADLESIFALNQLLSSLKAGPAHIDGCTNSSSFIPQNVLQEMRFTSTIVGIEEADSILFIGCNPLKDAPLLNARIRKSWLKKEVSIGYIGPSTPNLTFDYEYLGEDYTAIKSMKGSLFYEKLQNSAKPAIIVGQDALFSHENAQNTWNEILKIVKESNGNFFKDNWSGLNILPRTASFTGALMLGSDPSTPSFSLNEVVILLGADDSVVSELIKMEKRPFVVYIGHHGDQGAQIANIILPSAAFTEKDATFVNMEGRPQQTRAAVPPPGEAREDWAIIRAFSEFCGHSLPFNSLDHLRLDLWRSYPSLAAIDEISPSNFASEIMTLSEEKSTFNETAVKPYEVIKDYYLTDCISRHSPTMAKCSLAFTQKTIKDEETLDSLF